MMDGPMTAQHAADIQQLIDIYDRKTWTAHEMIRIIIEQYHRDGNHFPNGEAVDIIRNVLA